MCRESWLGAEFIRLGKTEPESRCQAGIHMVTAISLSILIAWAVLPDFFQLSLSGSMELSIHPSPCGSQASPGHAGASCRCEANLEQAGGDASRQSKGFCSTASKRCHRLSPVSDPWGLGPAWPCLTAMGEKLLTAQHVSGQRLQSWKKQDTHLVPTAVCCLHSV